MVWYSETFLDLPVKGLTAYSENSLKLELLDGFRIRITLDNCPNPEECECPSLHRNQEDNYLTRDLSIDEIKQLKEACDKLIVEYNKEHS